MKNKAVARIALIDIAEYLKDKDHNWTYSANLLNTKENRYLNAKLGLNKLNYSKKRKG
jgi:hypothetical protein